MSNKYNWKVGSTFVIFTPPGWIIGGTIKEIFDDYLILVDAVYFETVKNGASAMGGYSMARNMKELEAASDRSWPLPDGYVMRIDGILHAAPANMSFQRLSKKDQVAAIKGA